MKGKQELSRRKGIPALVLKYYMPIVACSCFAKLCCLAHSIFLLLIIID